MSHPCPECGTLTRGIRRATTPEAQKFWAQVEKAAANCPESVRKQAEEAGRKARLSVLCDDCV